LFVVCCFNDFNVAVLLLCDVVVVVCVFDSDEEWNSLGDAFAGSNEAVIARVDADEHQTLGSRFGIHGYPTLKWFAKGSTDPEEYVDFSLLNSFFSHLSHTSQHTLCCLYLSALTPTLSSFLHFSSLFLLFFSLFFSLSPLFFSLSPLFFSLSPLFFSLSPLFCSLSPLFCSLSPLFTLFLLFCALSSLSPLLRPFLSFSFVYTLFSYDGGRDLDNLVSYVSSKSGIVFPRRFYIFQLIVY
jgi:hypothetical protein